MINNKFFSVFFCFFLLFTSVSAFGKPVLNIYTYDGFASKWGSGPKIVTEFERTCNCRVEFTTVGKGIDILRRIQFEGTDTKADMVLGLNTNLLDQADNFDFFIKHKLKTGRFNLPIIWFSKTFLPFDYGYFSFIYDSSKLTNPPTSFEELAKKDDNFKIIIQDPRSSVTGLGLLLWIKKIYGDEAGDYWQRIAPKILTITKGWSEAYNMFLKNEADMVLSYTTSPAYHIINDNEQKYRAAGFDEGHYAMIEVAAILKSSRQFELAQKFMQFLISDVAQDIIPVTNWMYPVMKTRNGLPEGFKKLHIPSKTLLLNSTILKNQRKAMIEEWIEAISK